MGGRTDEIYVTEEVDESETDLRERTVEDLVNAEMVPEEDIFSEPDKKTVPYQSVKDPLVDTNVYLTPFYNFRKPKYLS